MAHGQHLRGKGLVELDHADVVQAQARLLQRLGNRKGRADAHVGRINAGEGVADNAGARLQAQLGGPFAVVTITAAAASFSGQALAGVTVPPFLKTAG